MPLNYKPESAYVEAFLENRYLEIAKGNEEVAFGRAACLKYNDEIVKIATAGEGLAVYWRAEGLQRLLARNRRALHKPQPVATRRNDGRQLAFRF